MTITIRDVASAAGVSPATVSRALRGLPNVDNATRARVQKVAADLDYVVSPSASRLASGRTGSIAVLTPYISRWYFSTVLSGVESVIQASGMDLLLQCVDDHIPGHFRSTPASRLRRRVDGVLVIAMPPESEQLLEVIDLGMPTALISVNVGDTPSVTIDDTEAARQATRHLVNLGHTRIGLINGDPAINAFTAEFNREAGYSSVIEEYSLDDDPLLRASGYYTISGGEQAMTALLTQRNPPTAVFCMSDEMAFGALRSLARHGLTPGKDISIVGIDGHDMSEHLDLTTIEQPVYDLGRIAAESLLAQINPLPEAEPMPTSVRVPTRLVVRGSTRPLSHDR
jgi:DNA-binding LacI/PurR family transcriptional regulator